VLPPSKMAAVQRLVVVPVAATPNEPAAPCRLECEAIDVEVAAPSSPLTRLS
jgi:hypothetical protein